MSIIDFESQNFAIFNNFYASLHKTWNILLVSSLAFNLEEGPIRCAKVCDKSWVILTQIYADEWTNFLILQQDTSNVCGSLALMSLILYIL